MPRPGVTLYFVRHGETDWNRAQRYQGQKDIPLNALGREQAMGNGRTLAAALGAQAATIDYVTSPLQRARETMELMRAELGLSPQGYRTDDRLREIHYGHTGRASSGTSCPPQTRRALRRARRTNGAGARRAGRATGTCPSAWPDGWTRSSTTW